MSCAAEMQSCMNDVWLVSAMGNTGKRSVPMPKLESWSERRQAYWRVVTLVLVLCISRSLHHVLLFYVASAGVLTIREDLGTSECL